MSRPVPDSEPPPHLPDRGWNQRLRAFCHVARRENVTEAAASLGISQPAVSRHVQALENELGIVLFERSGPRITLTPAGERLYRMALPLVAEMDRLLGIFVEEHRGVPSGTLRIAAGQASAACALPGYLKRFRERHPDTRVSVRVGHSRQRMGWLRSYEVDIVFGSADVTPPDAEFRPVFDSPIMLITPEDHPLAGRESLGIEEMVRWPMVAHPLGTYPRDFGEMVGRQHGVSGNVPIIVSGWVAIKRYVEAGVGIALVPDLCVSEGDRVHQIPFSRYFPPRTYGMTIRRGDLLPLAARHFMELFDSADAGRRGGEPA